jgi:hypothetical protein
MPAAPLADTHAHIDRADQPLAGDVGRRPRRAVAAQDCLDATATTDRNTIDRFETFVTGPADRARTGRTGARLYRFA